MKVSENAFAYAFTAWFWQRNPLAGGLGCKHGVNMLKGRLKAYAREETIAALTWRGGTREHTIYLRINHQERGERSACK